MYTYIHIKLLEPHLITEHLGILIGLCGFLSSEEFLTYLLTSEHANRERAVLEASLGGLLAPFLVEADQVEAFLCLKKIFFVPPLSRSPLFHTHIRIRARALIHSFMQKLITTTTTITINAIIITTRR